MVDENVPVGDRDRVGRSDILLNWKVFQWKLHFIPFLEIEVL